MLVNNTIRVCEYCSVELIRKNYKNGAREPDANFYTRRFCNQECMGLARVKSNPKKSTIRRRASKLALNGLRKDKCEKCGTDKKLHLHHIDSNPNNNNINNVMTLCASCHGQWHWEHGKKPPRPKRLCSICGNKVVGRGYCSKHYQRFITHGDPNFILKGKNNE